MSSNAQPYLFGVCFSSFLASLWCLVIEQVTFSCLPLRGDFPLSTKIASEFRGYFELCVRDIVALYNGGVTSGLIH